MYKQFYLEHQFADLQHINSVLRGVGSGGENNFQNSFTNTLNTHAWNKHMTACSQHLVQVYCQKQMAYLRFPGAKVEDRFFPFTVLT
jgi:hypothetical protein